MIGEQKTKRVQLISRLAPEDRDWIVERANRESRSIGEVLALIRKENELMALALGREA